MNANGGQGTTRQGGAVASRRTGKASRNHEGAAKALPSLETSSLPVQ